MLEKTSCHFSTGLFKVSLYWFVGFESRFLGRVFHSSQVQIYHILGHGSLSFLQIGDLLGGLILKGALTLQQAKTSVVNAAAATTSQCLMAMSQTGHRQHVMRGAIRVLAEHSSHAELQQQLGAAGLPLQYMPAKVSIRATFS